MPYVLAAPQHAEQLSRSLMRLLRPSHLRGDDWTDLYCPVVQHNGQAALALPDGETVPIHLESDGAELAALLGVFVADGALTQEEADGIAAAVQAYAGQYVSITDFIPPSWQQWVYTRQQMADMGWPVPGGPDPDPTPTPDPVVPPVPVVPDPDPPPVIPGGNDSIPMNVSL